MSYSRLVELSENLTLDSYDEWDSLVKKLFSDSEIKLIRKNAILGFIDEVKYIKSRAKYLVNLNGMIFRAYKDIQAEVESILNETFKVGK